MNDLISVIVPVYNVEKYLEKCVNSIIAQDYRNLEIILVDDGSPDGCPDLCDHFQLTDERILVIHQKNGGISRARNTGIARAKGAYLAFVDSDDYLEPDFISSLYEALVSNAGDLCIGNYFIDELDQNRIYENDYRPSGRDVLIVTGEDALARSEESVYWVNTQFKLYPARLFKKAAFQAGKIHEDEFILHEIFLQCGKVVCLNKCLYHYVQRSGSIMHAKSIRNVFNGSESMVYRAMGTMERIPYVSYRSLCRACTILLGIYRSKPETQEQKNELTSLKKSLKHTAGRLAVIRSLPVKCRVICWIIQRCLDPALFFYYLSEELFKNDKEI